MSLRVSGVFAFVLTVVCLSGCAEVRRGGTYTVPHVMTCTVPDGPNVQVKATTSSPDWGSIQFIDDLGHFYRLDYSRITPELRETFLPEKARSTLKTIFDRQVMPTIRTVSPEGRVAYEGYSTESGMPQYNVIVQIPKGSPQMHSVNGGPAERADDVRAVLITPKGAWCLVVWYSAGPYATPTALDETGRKELSAGLEKFVRGIQVEEPSEPGK